MKHFFREFFLNIVLGFVSAIFISFSIFVAAHFVISKANFTIISTHIVCEQPLNNRCVTHYQVVTDDKSTIDFVPLGHEFASDDLLIGSHIEKVRFSIDYKVNGIAKEWQYWREKLIRLSIGITGLFIRYLLLKLGFIKGDFFKQLILQSRSQSDLC